MMGGLRYKDKKRISFVIEKGDADTFYRQIKAWHILLRKKWVETGKPEENFQELEPKIVIILENHIFHKRKDILAKIEAKMPNIRLDFLPFYSQYFNLIELVWHSPKKYIAHRLFESVNQLEDLLNKLLNEG